MGDFILDLRVPGSRCEDARSLAFFDDQRIDACAAPAFFHGWSSVDRADLWAPFEAADGVRVAVSGRIVFDEREWAAGEQLAPAGKGGLAARILYERYRRDGIEALFAPNGACAIQLLDPGAGRGFVVTDPFGAFPCFQAEADGGWVLCSHPDVLATLTGPE